METKLISYESLENLLGQRDRQEASTNRGVLRAAKAVLRRAIREELTPRQRQCVELYFFGELTEEQVGRELGVEKSTVCRHLQKAKRRLAQAVSYAGTVCRALPED